MSDPGRGHLPHKARNLKQRVRECLAAQRIRYTRHALEEMEDDAISHMEIKQALRSGRHIDAKDFYDDEFQTWNYRFHGFTVGGERELGVVFALDEETGMLLITAFDRSRDRRR